MRRVAFDFETHLIKGGMLYPKGVCVSFYDGQTKDIYLVSLGIAKLIQLLRDPEIILIGHNVAFDLGIFIAEAIDQGYDPQEILALVFAAYDQDRIVDTMVRTMLIDIALGDFQEIDGQRRGKAFGLDQLALRWLGIKLQKKDTWRLHYAALDGVPLAQWPQDAIDYSILDSEIAWKVDEAITQWAIAEDMSITGKVPDEDRQFRAAFVLHLIAGWGVHVDNEMVRQLRKDLEAKQQQYHKILDDYKIFKKDRYGNYKRTKKGQICKDQKLLQQYITEGFAAQNQEPPTTAGRVNKKTGERVPAVQVSEDTALESGHPAAIAYAESKGTDKLLSTYVPALELGINGWPIVSSPNVLVASGRTSWAKPNWQNPPQKGKVRECVIPRSGKVFVAADLDTVELRALAQCCLEKFGYSEMAAALQRGEDLHLGLAAEILGLSYEEAERLYEAGDPTVDWARFVAKKVNFGLPGGMGPPKFARTQINEGQPLIKDPDAPFSEHVKRAYELREAWFRKWPEMRAYLKEAGYVCDEMTGTNTIEQPWSGRIRGGLTYCAAANTLFQGRVADGTKLALWRLAKACYVDTTSILYGSRIVLFLHDEVIIECDEEVAHECAQELVRILCGAVQEVIPSIPITSKPVITRRWYKGSKAVTVNGRIVPCKPMVDSLGKVKWVADHLN